MNPGLSESVILPNSTQHQSTGRRTISFSLRPNNDNFRRIDIDLELRELPNKGKEFTASAMIWGRSRNDCEIAGQCLDQIDPKQTDNPALYSEIVALWERWHLNGMRAGCKHQKGWEKIKLDDSLPLTQSNMAIWEREEEHPRGLLCKPCPVCGYKYGSAWLFEEIEEADLRRIEEIISGNAFSDTAPKQEQA